jgi:ATP-dependent RNA helicase DeaD
LNSFASFDDLDLPESISKNLTKMKFINPTPVQAETILPALEGKDILGTAQTGTGKTAAFGIPLLARLYPHPGKAALILAPTRELAAQILKVLREMTRGTDMEGILLVGGESFARQMKELKQGGDYIVATPGRLIDHLQQKTVKLSRVEILVLDEVDRMLDMGFAPQVRQIMKHVPAERQTLVFSATLPREVMTLLTPMLKSPIRVEIKRVAEDEPSIREETLRITHDQKDATLLKEVEARTGRILIFARTQSRTERVARLLDRKGYEVVALHGGLRQSQRKKALEGFRNGFPRLMVATDLAGRGIDVTDIEHVINYDLPGSREDYIHRIGRTGRWGKEGVAVNLLTPEDIEGERIISGKKAPPRFVFRTKRWPAARRTR